MDQGYGSGSIPIDRNRVLDVKPLRCLAPIFPSQDSTNGSYPSGASSSYPFFNPDSQRPGGANHGRPSPYPIQSPVPLNSFSPAGDGMNGGVGSSKRKFKNRSVADDDAARMRKARLKAKNGPVNISFTEVDLEHVVNNLLKSFNLLQIDTFQQTDSDKDLVDRVLLVYSLLRRKITQIDDSNIALPGVTKRPDLRSATILLKKGARANIKKRIGAVPGIAVGDIFFLRMEMCLVGLHAPSMAGIDYLSVKLTGDEEPLAVSIVSSGGYDDDGDDGEVLIYSGQGGVQRRDKQLMDQKLERGNLALEKSLHRANEVRVIRGLKDLANLTGKVYVYDGLYKIHESWVEKGKSGCSVFKYKLMRNPGQPEAFTLWKSIQQWKDGVASRPGVILPDLTSGAEKLPVSLVNDVDNEKGPAYFTYLPSLKYSKPFTALKPSLNCNCSGGCQPGNSNCPCLQRNGGFIPYSSLGVLFGYNTVVHECGPSCLCPPNCRNRTSQAGLKVRLEVFKTKNKGWGLRSWDPIRAGAFICEYAGEVIDASTGIDDDDDNYIFDTTRMYEPLEAVFGVHGEPPVAPFPLVINAKNGGNIARFMNHSCYPNVMWQSVLRENDNESYLHVAFFSIRHIPPMQELTFNYGMVRPDKAGTRRKKCLCGSSKCRGYFY